MNITTLASGSSGNAYVVSDGNTTLLLEAGLPAHKLCTNTELSKVDACVITHEHMDHARGAVDLINRYGIPVITSQGTLERLRLTGSFGAEKIADGEEVRCGSMIIKAFAVPHDAVEPLGYLIKSTDGSKLLFITDAFYVPVKAPQGLTHLMVECNHSVALLDEVIAMGGTPHEQRERIRRSHMSLETLCSWFEKNEDRLGDLQEIHLIHISERNGDAAAFRQKIREITGRAVY